MTIKVYLHVIRSAGVISIYASLSDAERTRKVAQYCRDAWTDVFRPDVPLPADPHERIAKFFNAPGIHETLHYDTDWLRPEDFAACPNAIVIDDSVLLTPTPK